MDGYGRLWTAIDNVWLLSKNVVECGMLLNVVECCRMLNAAERSECG